jgi:hypothetical protein
MYLHIDLLFKVEIDGVECGKRLQCFTQVLYGSISDVGAPRKKKEIE